MVRNGEHAESIITNCSSAIKGDRAVAPASAVS